jgi:hypothetical protein
MFGCFVRRIMASEGQLSRVLGEFARTMVTDFPIQEILDELVVRIVDIMPITGGRGNPDLSGARTALCSRFE